MLIVDAHLDLAYNAVVRHRDVTRPALEQPVTHNEIPTCGLPDLRAANVGLVCATIFAALPAKSPTVVSICASPIFTPGDIRGAPRKVNQGPTWTVPVRASLPQPTAKPARAFQIERISATQRSWR